MPRRLSPGLVVLAAVLLISSAPQARQQPAARPLVIEDYYRIQSVGNPTISPDARWVTYTVSTRVEEDNSTETQSWVVAADGPSKPARVLHYGRDVSGARWTTTGRLEYVAERQTWSIEPANLTAAPQLVRRAAAAAPPAGGRGGRGGRGGPAASSADGRWTARTVDREQPRTEPAAATDFERRHEERFKGAIFDWKDFQRDGQPFPAPDPTARPGQRVEIQPAAGGEPKVL